MKPLDEKYTPLPNEIGEWWDSHVVFSKFKRQGLDIVCASFEHSSKPLANIILVTGWSETFLKYAEVVKHLFDHGFNVHTYDHQSQGLSGRWLSEHQSTWIHSFDDYVDDFVYFVTSVTRQSPALPVYVVAHSMGGLVAAIAMSRLPSLVNRAVLCAPMIRNKSGLKALNYLFPPPQPLAYALTRLSCWLGMGFMHALGYFKEHPCDQLQTGITTNCKERLIHWQLLREKYPSIMSTCVTNDWVVHAIRAQIKFESRFQFVRTNTLILAAENDRFVYNRAMQMLATASPASKMFLAPGACHELLFETDDIRAATLKAILDFFTQASDDVSLVQPAFPLIEQDKDAPLFSVLESIVRTVGIAVASVGVVSGLAVIIGGKDVLVSLASFRKINFVNFKF